MVARRKIAPVPDEQVILARELGFEFCDGAKLKPLDFHGSFPIGIPVGSLYYVTRPMTEVAWNVVAHLMADACPDRVMDHAFLLGFDDNYAEPWGFVTQPYMTDSKATAFAAAMHHQFSDWGIQVVALPASRSSWNPGSTPPIAAILNGRGLIPLVQHAIGWMLPQLTPF